MEDILPNTNHINNGETAQPLQAALYARVSTERQEKEETIESQVAEVKQKIEEDGNILPPKNLFVDDGWTGMMLVRPALDAMRDAIKENRIQVVYVYDLGRLSRDFTNQLILLREFEIARIKFISLRDINPTTPAEEMMQKIMGIFHDYDRRNTAEKFRRGKLFKARSGILINGSALYGYNYIKKTETEPAHYEVNEEEARAVRLIWHWHAVEGVSMHSIIKKLYDLGIRPRKRKSPFWSRGPITRMLKCETYASGQVYYNKSEAVEAKKPIKNDKYKRVSKTSRRIRTKEDWIPFKVPIIIDDPSLYEKNKRILELNKKYARKNKKYNYLLSEIIWCGCGNRRAGDGCSKTGHFYYRCIERIHKFPRKDRRCHLKGANAVILDQMLWDELMQHLQSKDLIRKHAEAWLKNQAVTSVDTQHRTNLEAQIEKITEEEKRYSKAYGSGALEFEQYMELVKDAKKRKKGFQKEIEEQEALTSKESIDIGVDELCDETEKVLCTMNFSNKKQIVRDIIEKVIIKERRTVEVWCHILLPQLITASTVNVGYEPIGGYRWFGQCWEIYPF